MKAALVSLSAAVFLAGTTTVVNGNPYFNVHGWSTSALTFDEDHCFNSYPTALGGKMRVGYAKSHANYPKPLYQVSRDKGTLALNPVTGEKYVTLTHPILPGRGGPFDVKFDIIFPTRPNNGVGRHGGIYWGSKVITDGRWNGHRRKQDAAKVSVIDWIDRASDHGIRIYGVNSPTTMNGFMRDSPNPPKKWHIRFLGDDKDTFRFFADGKLIATFEGVSSEGYIGFYGYGDSGLLVNNFRIENLPMRHDC